MTAVDHRIDSGRDRLVRLFRERSSRVHGFVLARSGNVSVAEEITAQTFEEAARRVAQGREGEVTDAWLTTVAQRRLVDHWRRSTRQRRLVDRIGQDVTNTVPPVDPVDERVAAALDSLPMNQRAVVALRYLDDWSVGEIADGLGLTYRATESLLARGRRSLRSALEGHDGY